MDVLSENQGEDESELERKGRQSGKYKKICTINPDATMATKRLIGAILLKQNDEWAFPRARYMTLETIAPLSGDPVGGLPAVDS